MHTFDFDSKTRNSLLINLFKELDEFLDNTQSFPVTPKLDADEIKAFVRKISAGKETPNEVIAHVLEGMKEYAVLTPHPKYFGLYNPRANFAGILADLITATFNPQLAAWSHSPFASEVENYVIEEFGKRFGFPADSIDGVFAGGGAEANHNALLCAINYHFPEYEEQGFIGLRNRPVLYCSAEAHHSVDKAAKLVGLGFESVRHIPVREDLKMDHEALLDMIEQDEEAGNDPFMLIATAGTTGTGTIEDLELLGEIARDNNLWFHVDGAYGGGAVLSEQLKPELSGIEHADSITFDAHKWMSVPMATSLFITRHTDILERTFRISTEYMPKEAKGMDVIDPFTHSIQWSRRFIGLKVYLALMMYGWDGYKKIIDHQTEVGNYLKEQLTKHGWEIMNPTPLPVVCFTDPNQKESTNFARFVVDGVIQSKQSWISEYPVHGVRCIRACITNYLTSTADIDALISELNTQRNNYLT